ncbi:MAG: HD domain-containing protein [Acidimicrobiales bacterium]
MEHVSWTEMKHGTVEDYAFLGERYNAHAQGELIENLVKLLRVMEGPKLGYQIDRYQHCLQSATRALRADESLDLVVAALLHDIGDSIAPYNHSATAAALLRPYIDEQTHWVVLHHGLFQGYYYFHHLGGDRDAREVHSGHEHYQACADFCEKYDQNCFDPDYDTLPIEAFIPMMEELFSRESRVPGVAPAGMTADVHIN